MKDAKGHGSNPRGAHAAGVDQIGQPVRQPIQVFRAVTPHNENGNSQGHTYWSSDRHYVENDVLPAGAVRTRTEQAVIESAHISRSPSGADPERLHDLVPKAQAKGYKAIEVSEGRGSPKSIFVFDKSALRDRRDVS